MRRLRHHLSARLALGLGAALAALAVPGSGLADDLRLSIEEELVSTDIRSLDKTTGERTHTSAVGFSQKYRLDLQRYIMPNLVLRGGGLFERVNAWYDLDDGSNVDTTGTRISPYVDLTLRTDLYLANVGFRRREEKLESSNAATTKLTRDSYTAAVAWFPDELPSLDFRYERNDIYDADRTRRDTTTQSFGLLSDYQPVEEVTLHYQGRLTETENRVADVTTDEIWHSGRGTYSDTFFQDRVDLYLSQEVIWRETTTETSRRGARITTVVTPIAGLSALDDTPQDGALANTPALIDGDVNVSAGINLGLPPITEFPVLPRNLGLDLLNTSTEISGVYVYVDPTVELPTAVSASFRWDVYTSPNNTDWTRIATALPGNFDALLNRFEVSFPTVQSRYLKVVANPLGAGVPDANLYPNIFVTELQATATVTQGGGNTDSKRTTSQTQYLTNAALRIRLLETPELDYYSTLFYSDTTEPDSYNLIVTNGLRAFHRFSPVYSGTADVAREDTDTASTRTETYRYSTSVTATPLSTLTSTLTYSGRNEETTRKTTTESQETDSQSLLLSVQAQLYRGIQAVTNGGYFLSTQANGDETVTTRLDTGLDITPNDKLTLNLYGTLENTETSGDTTSTERSTQRARAAVSYSPFTTLSLYMAVDYLTGDTESQTLQNYAVNWSPFRDGKVQFTFAYQEQLDSVNNSSERYLSPSVRWNIRPSVYLDMAYTLNESDSDTNETTINTFRLTLHAVF